MNGQSVIGSRMANVFDDESLTVDIHSEMRNKNENKANTSVDCADLDLINVATSSSQINTTSPYRITPNNLLKHTATSIDSSRFAPHHFTQLHSTLHSTHRSDDVRENGESTPFRDATVTREPIVHHQYETNLDQFSIDTSGMAEYFCLNGHCNNEAPTKSLHHCGIDNLDRQSQNEISPNANSLENTLFKHLSPSVNSIGIANKGSVSKVKQGTYNTGATSDVTAENDLSDDGYMDELEALGSFDNGAHIFYNSVRNRGPSVPPAGGLCVAEDLGDFIETDIPRRNLSNSSRSSCSNDSRASSCEDLSALIATGCSVQDSLMTGAGIEPIKKLLDPHNNSLENNEDCLDVGSSANVIAPKVVKHSYESVGSKNAICSNGFMNCVNDLSQVSEHRWENHSSVSPNSYAGLFAALSTCSNSVTSSHLVAEDHGSYEVNNADKKVVIRMGKLNGTDIDGSSRDRASDSSLELDFSSARSPDESNGTPILPLSPLDDEIAAALIGAAGNAHILSTKRHVEVLNVSDDIGQLCNEENATANVSDGRDDATADEIPVRRHSYSNMLDNIERNVASKRAQDKRVDWTMVNSFSAEDSPREYSLTSATARLNRECTYCNCASATSLRCYCLCHGKRTVSDDAPSTFNSARSSSPGRRSKCVNSRTLAVSGGSRRRGEGMVAEEGLNWYSDDEDTARNTDSFGGSASSTAYARKSYPKLGIFSRSRVTKCVDKIGDCSCWNGASQSPSSVQVNGRQREMSVVGMSDKVSNRMLNCYDADINNIGRQDTYSTENSPMSINTSLNDTANQRYTGETWDPLNSEWKSQDVNEEKRLTRPTICAMNAVRTVLKELKVNYDHARLSEMMRNSTDSLTNSTSLTDYLISASNEGISADDLITRVVSVTDNEVYGRFFEIPETSTFKASDVDLQTFLTYWMNKGAVPLATLNMAACTQDTVSRSKLIGSDAWHHQIINRIGDGMCLMDEMRRNISEEELSAELRGRSTILVSRSDVISRWNDECNLSTLITRTDRRWRTLNVIGQVVNMLRERQMTIEGGYRPQQTAQVTLPTHFRAGITLFVQTGTRVHKELVNAESTVPLRSPTVVPSEDCAGSIVIENSAQAADCREFLNDSLDHFSSRLPNRNENTRVYTSHVSLLQK